MRLTFQRNLFWLGVATAGTMLGSFIYGIVVARYLGPADFGRYSLVIGVGGWLMSMAQSGGTTALLVLAAKYRDQASKLMWPGAAIQTSTGVLATVISLPALWFLSKDSALLPLAILYGIAHIAWLATTVPVSIFRGLDRMEWGISNFGSYILILLFMSGVIYFDLGLTSTVAVNTIAQLLILSVVWPLARRKMESGRFSWDKIIAKRLFLASIALWGVTIVQALHWRIGLVMVQLFSGSFEVGIYMAAAKLIESLRIIPWFLLLAVLPTFIQTAQTNPKERDALVRIALRYVLLLGFPLSGVILILAPIIVDLLYTTDYAPSYKVLQICSLGLVPLFAHWVFLNIMISTGLERPLIYTYLICISFEVLLDAILIPTWGVIGAAIGYVAGESLAAIISGLYVIRTVGTIGRNDLFRISAPGLFILAVGFLPVEGIGLITQAIFLFLLYISGILLFKAISLSEIKMLIWRQQN